MREIVPLSYMAKQESKGSRHSTQTWDCILLDNFGPQQQ